MCAPEYVMLYYATTILKFDNSFNIPPDFPRSDIILIFLFVLLWLHELNSSTPFFSFPPPVEIRNKTSPSFPCASTCLFVNRQNRLTKQSMQPDEY